MNANKRLLNRMIGKLLNDYRESERTVICEMSGEIYKDFDVLDEKIRKMKKAFKKLVKEI